MRSALIRNAPANRSKAMVFYGIWNVFLRIGVDCVTICSVGGQF